MSSKFKKILSKSLLTLLMLVIGVTFIIPFLWMISASLKLPLQVFEFPIKWIPENPLFSNYTEVWFSKNYPFMKFYFNSIKVAAGTIMGALLVCSTAAYAFGRLRFKGKNIVFLLFMSTLMVPTQVTLVPRFFLFYKLDLFNTLWALILPSLFYVVGIFMLRQFYHTIPNELSESAQMDGAGHLRIWLSIIIPLTKPATISLIILMFVFSWNDYLNPLIFLNSVDMYTIPRGIQIWMESEGQQLQLVMVAATISTVPVIFFFLFLQKYFIRGIATSGIKG